MFLEYVYSFVVLFEYWLINFVVSNFKSASFGPLTSVDLLWFDFGVLFRGNFGVPGRSRQVFVVSFIFVFPVLVWSIQVGVDAGL